jgi:hypothetical protein
MLASKVVEKVIRQKAWLQSYPFRWKRKKRLTLGPDFSFSNSISGAARTLNE